MSKASGDVLGLNKKIKTKTCFKANEAEVTRLKEVVYKIVVMFSMSLGITGNFYFSCY